MRFKTEMIEKYIRKRGIPKAYFCILCGINLFEYAFLMDENCDCIGRNDMIVNLSPRIVRVMRVEIYDLFEE